MTPAELAERAKEASEAIRLPEPDGPVLVRPTETPEEAAYRAAVDAAISVLEAYDGGTAEHSDDVLTLSEAIAEHLVDASVSTDRNSVKESGRVR